MTENLFKFNYSKKGITGFVSLDRVDDEYVLSSDCYKDKRSSDFEIIRRELVCYIIDELFINAALPFDVYGDISDRLYEWSKLS